VPRVAAVAHNMCAKLLTALNAVGYM
jgi:hypothetical protein